MLQISLPASPPELLITSVLSSIQSMLTRFVNTNPKNTIPKVFISLEKLQRESQARIMVLALESTLNWQKSEECFVQFQHLDKQSDNILSLMEIKNSWDGRLIQLTEIVRSQNLPWIQLSCQYQASAKALAELADQYQKLTIELHWYTQQLRAAKPGYNECKQEEQLLIFQEQVSQLEHQYQELLNTLPSPTTLYSFQGN